MYLPPGHPIISISKNRNQNGRRIGKKVIVAHEIGPKSFEPLVHRGCRAGAVVRALASHQCGPGSIPRLGVICRLNLLVLYSASPGNPVFSYPQKQTFDLISFALNLLISASRLPN